MSTAKSDRADAVITHVTLSEARARLGAVVKRVRDDKGYVVLERDGEPVAVMVDIEEFEDLLELRDPEVQRIIQEGHADELADRVRPASRLLEELRADDEEERVVENGRLAQSMPEAFRVRTTAGIDRLAKAHRKRHRDFTERFADVLVVLEGDPLNHTRTHPIRKLAGQKPCDGQYRLRLGRWRFRYDVSGAEVTLRYCVLRREDTYR